VGRAGALSAIVRGDPPLFLPTSVHIWTRRASRYGTLRAQSRLSVRQEPEGAPRRRSHAIDRPSNAPAAAGNRHGRGPTLSAAPAARACIAGGSHPLGGARRVRSDGTPDPRAHRFAGRGRGHPPWGECSPGLLDAQRLVGRVPTARDTCPPMVSLRTAIAQACSSRRPMCGTASPRTLIPYRSSYI
jgi:hypothetical protein